MFAKDEKGNLIYRQVACQYRTETIPKNPSVTGYGSKIPTSYKVKLYEPDSLVIENRWRRVYCMIYSNSGSVYVISKGVKYLISGIE